MFLKPLTTEKFREFSAAKAKASFFIYKHSNTCIICLSARKELIKYAVKPDSLPIYELELHEQRPLSNLISEQFKITHESPQVILVKDSHKPVWHCSKFLITQESLEKAVSKHA